MTTKLTIPKKITETVPKPTKKQLIDALVEVARKEAEEENERNEKIRKEIEQKIKDIALGILERNPQGVFNASNPSLNVYWKTVYIELNLSGVPAAKKLFEKLANVGHKYFSEKETKAEIARKLAAPNPLIGNDSVKPALETLYHAIFNKPQTIEVGEEPLDD